MWAVAWLPPTSLLPLLTSPGFRYDRRTMEHGPSSRRLDRARIEFIFAAFGLSTEEERARFTRFRDTKPQAADSEPVFIDVAGSTGPPAEEGAQDAELA